MTRKTIDDLLAVQDRDTRLDQLRHQLDVLAERAARDEAAAALDSVDAAIAARDGERADLDKARRRLADEVDSLDAKRKAHDETLYGGSVTNARELQDLQEEIASLARRIESLEDEELELMEQIEPLDAQLADLTGARTDRAAALDAAAAALVTAEADLRAQLDAVQAERDDLATAVPDDLRREYDQLRAGGGGVGIARLIGGNQCGGCHLTLSAVEVAAIRKNPDEITHCEECGRLLVT